MLDTKHLLKVGPGSCFPFFFFWGGGGGGAGGREGGKEGGREGVSGIGFLV